MRNIIPFTLSFVLACILGITAELSASQLYHHAHKILNGKPLPPISEAILFLFFALSSLLPFIPNYGMIPNGVSIGAYVPHMLVFMVFAVVIITAVIQIFRRHNNR
jgi:hypothetical protein